MNTTSSLNIHTFSATNIQSTSVAAAPADRPVPVDLKVSCAINVYGSLSNTPDLFESDSNLVDLWNGPRATSLSLGDCSDISAAIIRNALNGDLNSSAAYLASMVWQKPAEILKKRGFSPKDSFLCSFDHEAAFPWKTNGCNEAYARMIVALKCVFPNASFGMYGVPYRSVWESVIPERAGELNAIDALTAKKNIGGFPHLYVPYDSWKNPDILNMTRLNLNRWKNSGFEIFGVYLSLMTDDSSHVKQKDPTTNRIDYSKYGNPVLGDTFNLVCREIANVFPGVPVLLWAGAETTAQAKTIYDLISTNFAPAVFKIREGKN